MIDNDDGVSFQIRSAGTSSQCRITLPCRLSRPPAVEWSDPSLQDCLASKDIMQDIHLTPSDCPALAPCSTCRLFGSMPRPLGGSG
jgi:hypothetical protein